MEEHAKEHCCVFEVRGAFWGYGNRAVKTLAGTKRFAFSPKHSNFLWDFSRQHNNITATLRQSACTIKRHNICGVYLRRLSGRTLRIFGSKNGCRFRTGEREEYIGMLSKESHSELQMRYEKLTLLRKDEIIRETTRYLLIINWICMYFSYLPRMFW